MPTAKKKPVAKKAPKVKTFAQLRKEFEEKLPTLSDVEFLYVACGHVDDALKSDVLNNFERAIEDTYIKHKEDRADQVHEVIRDAIRAAVAKHNISFDELEILANDCGLTCFV